MLNGFETVIAAGDVRILNCQPSPQHILARATPFHIPGPITDIHDFNFRPPWLAIKNQDGVGACVGHGGTRAIEAVRALSGQDGGAEAWQELSAWDLYARLCGGIDQGANIGDALKMLADDGVALMGAVPYGTYDPRRIPAAAAAQRPRFKIEFGDLLTSFEQIAWATAMGYAVAYSVHAGGGFSGVDSEGVPDYQRGQADHCVVAYGKASWSKKHGLLIGSDNSWTAQWGDRGHFSLCDAMIQAQTYFEAWVVYASFDDPVSQDNPPLAA